VYILIPVDDTDPKHSEITKITNVHKWAILNFDEGVIKDIEFVDDRTKSEAEWIDFVVLADKYENYLDFMNEGIMVLCVREEKTIEEIVEAFKFKELDEVGF